MTCGRTRRPSCHGRWTTYARPGACTRDHVAQAEVNWQLGNVALARESSRHVWVAPSAGKRLAGRARTGLRIIRKSPQLAATALLSLAIGIGANSAVLSMLLRPIPYPDAERLVMVRAVHPADQPDRALCSHAGRVPGLEESSQRGPLRQSAPKRNSRTTSEPSSSAPPRLSRLKS